MHASHANRTAKKPCRFIMQGKALLLARSLWRIESERSTASFEDSHDRSAGHENGSLPFLGMMRTHRVRRSCVPDESANANVLVVSDGGSENFGEVDQLLEDSSSLRRVLAQIDIISSNSLIEAFWRQLKHAWLFLNTLESTAAVRRLVAFYIGEHNEKIPRAVLGARTRDEVYFGREEDLRECLSEQRKTAQHVTGARRIEPRVVIAATLRALALLSGVSPEQGLVDNLLGNLHDVRVSSTFPPDTSSGPLFELLGAEDKKHVLFDTGHTAAKPDHTRSARLAGRASRPGGACGGAASTKTTQHRPVRKQQGRGLT